jgi:dephospho-CoA kinase
MFTVGLTGNAATGKSTVAQILSDHEYFKVWDSDSAAKEIALRSSSRSTIKNICGPSVFVDDSLDIARLRKCLFSSDILRSVYETWMHPKVWEQIRFQMSIQSSLFIPVIESAILYEVGWEDRFDVMVVVACSQDEQIRRMREDRNMAQEQIEQTLRAQLSIDEKVSRAQNSGGIVIMNNGDKADLQIQVNNLIQTLENQKEEQL